MSSNQNDSNKEREHLPANEQNELPANTPQSPLENEQAGSSETTHVIFQTDPPMEVHAHSHTPRKKWTHYFWEFFMLFLAVTAGFFVENQREHFIEHQREKVYIRSLFEDLKKDTAGIRSLAVMRTEVCGMIDSLILLLKNKSRESFSSRIYYLPRKIPY